jgi:hypothetical protein
MDAINPDPSFVKQAKTIDKRLGVKFNGDHFVVTYDRGYGEPVNIHRVKAEDGGFRQPDRRDIEFIRSFDMENESCKERLARLAKSSIEIRERLKKTAKDDIRHMTRDNKNQLIKAIVQKDNSRKGNAAFRRISP